MADPFANDEGMTRTMDVLVLEHRRGAARAAVEELEAAGHRVHACHAPGEPSFPCRGVVDPTSCPLEGPVDVALVVRHHVHPAPSTLESGVSCALRMGVPVVEDGPSVLDPFEPWITARVGEESVADTCQRAIDLAHEPVLADIAQRCAPLLADVGLDASALTGAIELTWPRLQIRLDLSEPTSPSVREAIAVRALDAVRTGRRSYGTTNVHVSGPDHEVGPDESDR